MTAWDTLFYSILLLQVLPVLAFFISLLVILLDKLTVQWHKANIEWGVVFAWLCLNRQPPGHGAERRPLQPVS